MEYRKPTKDEELKAWHALMFKINLHRTITMNQSAIVDCLKKIDAWVAAHATGNGERKDADIQRNVNRAFWEHIAEDPSVGVKRK